jgi:hypothetical protein
MVSIDDRTAAFWGSTADDDKSTKGSFPRSKTYTPRSDVATW